MMDSKESDKSDIESVEGKAIEGSISCRSYMDTNGRVYVPLRVRDRAGLERGVGYDVQIEGAIISAFQKEGGENKQ